MLALLEQFGIFKKMSQKAGTNPKPNTPEQDDPVFTRIDKEIDEIRYGNVEGGPFCGKHQRIESPFSGVLSSEVHVR